MTDPIVRFVTAPLVDADTRFDCHLNNGEDAHRRWTDRDSFSWTPGALLGEPDGIGADYGLGRVDFTLYVRGTRAEARATFSGLAREMQRDENYLLFQLDPSAPPMWLRLYRASAGALSFPYIDPDRPEGDVWVMPVSLPTEATALGERESFTVTIANDPEAEDGLAVVLPEIKGDAPAPLVIETAAVSAFYAEPLFSVAAYDLPADEWPGVQFWQAESWTNSTDAADAADAAASGGNKVVIDFATTEDDARRLYANRTTALAGRWLLFARVKPSNDDGVTVRGGGDALVRGVETDLVEDRARLVELGEYAFPRGNMPMSRPYVLSSSFDAGTAVEVYASRPGSSTATLAIDYIVALPVDGIDLANPVRTLRLRDFVSSLAVVRFSGETELMERLGGGSHFGTLASPTLRGAFPQVVPGATNVFHLFPVAGEGADDDITEEYSLTLSFHPRYVWLPSD